MSSISNLESVPPQSPALAPPSAQIDTSSFTVRTVKGIPYYICPRAGTEAFNSFVEWHTSMAWKHRATDEAPRKIGWASEKSETWAGWAQCAEVRTGRPGAMCVICQIPTIVIHSSVNGTGGMVKHNGRQEHSISLKQINDGDTDGAAILNKVPGAMLEPGKKSNKGSAIRKAFGKQAEMAVNVSVLCVK